MEKFRVESMAPTGLISADPSASPLSPMIPRLELDTRTGAMEITFGHQSDNAVIMAVWHGIVLRWQIPITADAEALTGDINAGELDALLARIVDGSSIRWDGSNHVGRLTEDAQDAKEIVEGWLNTYADTLPGDCPGLWAAESWLVDGPSSVDGLTAATTDEELATMAERLEAEALGESVVLAHTLLTLEGFREQLRERAEEWFR